MTVLLDDQLSTVRVAFLVVALLIALGFEFVNGFHDTANAVATVIYTRALKPTAAVLWSGFWNFLGALSGGVAVAFTIVHLLPVDVLVEIGNRAGLVMVLALLLSAILWNLGTWYKGLPASSSHTLIGSIMGVGLANSLLVGTDPWGGVNWAKARDVGLSLLLSPAIGFVLAAAILLVARRVLRDPKLFTPPDPTEKGPPFWIRALLILTCTGVSYAHGSNDGKKGVGLIMLILIGLLPNTHALNLQYSSEKLHSTTALIAQAQRVMEDGAKPGSPSGYGVTKAKEAGELLARHGSLTSVPRGERWQVRRTLMELDGSLGPLMEETSPVSSANREVLKKLRKELRSMTEYAPTWVLLAVALALGIGTTIGWKRIVVTVGEKIGKAHLTYAQGASAELVAMTTIGMADHFGLPVSTIQVLSSGVAGTMAANRSGIQIATVRNIALAWLLTFPVSMLLSGTLYLVFRAWLT